MKDHYICIRKGVSISGMAHSLERWLKKRGMETQVFRHPDGNYVIQARRRKGDAAMLLGMDKTLCVSITGISDTVVKISAGNGMWKDKAAAAAVSMFVCWPLMFTAAYGAADQLLLIERAVRHLKNYASGTGDIEH